MRRLELAVALVVALACGAVSAARGETADLVISGGIVVTVDAKFSVFSPGAIAVKDGRILAVGPAAEVSARYSARNRYDATGKLVIPGLVNTHTHAAMTLLRGLADDLPLDRWLTEEVTWQVQRNPATKEKTQLALNAYIGPLIKVAENAMIANVLNDYHAVFWRRRSRS